LRPLIKWAGGKRALLPLLSEAWQDGSYTRLIEPFAGSAAFFFAVEPQAALLADTCQPLMAMYMSLQAFPEAFSDAFEALCSLNPQPGEEAYYEVRERFNAGKLSCIDEAAHFLYLNRFCFQGLWRVNARGIMNTGYGHYPSPPIPTRLAVFAVSRVLQRAQCFCEDWGTVAREAGPGDFLYLDPPYFGCWGSYSPDGADFDLEAYTQIEAVGRAAANRGASVVVSSRDCPAIRAIFRKSFWGYLPVGVVQRIAPQNGGRQPEMLLIAS
jgi:DNA adenine methylase